MMYPLVRELAASGAPVRVPVAVTCRVLGLARQPYYRWLNSPVTDAELAEAYRANALFDAHRDDPEFGHRFLADEARAAGEAMAERIAYLVGAQMYGLFKLWRMHRILKVYPWRQQPDGVHADRRRSRWVRAVFVLPNPDQPEKTESPEEHGGTFRIWDRVVRKGFDDELWYAGDPRFACVVARPGPKTLSYVAQPTAYDQRTSPRRKGLSPEARDRARAIGARVAD
ncbi:hypothetical protein OHA71_15550 [Streptomyces sp. NBC_00444]|uniref:hypothetical protein n=1 Tax=Streptomyces sp. NBC_00444 TaxID=2975744 RepID=UPI002E1C4400